MFWLIVTGTIVAIICSKIIAPYQYWKSRRVKQGMFVPILGDSWGIVFGKHTLSDMLQYVYNKVPDVRYSGVSCLLSTILLIKDPLLIKQMFVKDFDHFVNHNSLTPYDADPIWTRSLGSLLDTDWKHMRTIVSPTFTSSKMRALFTLMSKTAKDFTQFFVNQEKKDIFEMEMMDAFSRYTNDVIANSVFGIECNSLVDRENEFFMMGTAATNYRGGWNFIIFLITSYVPKLGSLLKLKLINEKVADFFRNVVNETIEYRDKNNISRPDIIHLLMRAKEEQNNSLSAEKDVLENKEDEIRNQNTKRILSNEDITAQALTFFVGGFDSVSTLLCFMAHELAMNPDVQEKLRAEIDAAFSETHDLSYETLSSLTYLDMVVSETLRKWPTTPATDRVCTKSYIIEPKNSDEKTVCIEKGLQLWIPILPLHRDPKYFPNPTKFYPKRFSTENKSLITPYTYIPFGIGPRNCIASRFAVMETKALFCYLLSKFEIIPITKTDTKMVLSKKGMFTIQAANGFWLGLKRRD